MASFEQSISGGHKHKLLLISLCIVIFFDFMLVFGKYLFYIFMYITIRFPVDVCFKSLYLSITPHKS